MKSQAKSMLKALLSRSDHQTELMQYLPSSLVQDLQSLPTPESFDPNKFWALSKWPASIHYSWFYDLFKDFPEKVRPLFLSVLTPFQVQGLNEMLVSHSTPSPTSRFIYFFLKFYLKEQIQEEDLLSEAQLPPSPFNLLFKLKRVQLIHIVDLLGIHDLAADLRQVVDKTLLNKIHLVLTSEQRSFLEYCGKQPMKWISPKLGLLSWDGTKKQLNHLLHQRGLIRLARAIFEEHPSFKWQLLHRLDTGRAKIIQNELYRKQDRLLLPFFKNQVLHITKRYSEVGS